MKMQKLVLTCLVLAVGYFGLRSFAQEPKAQLKNVPEFDVRGISFTECACTAYACPCRSNGHPTKGSCDAADFTFIREGHYGNVDMGGFKAVLVGDVIDMDASKVHATGYFDEKTTPEQRKAFGEMMDFMFGWNPPHMVGTRLVPIEFTESPDKTVYTLKVPGILEEKAIMKRDKNGKPLHEVPAMDLWGNKIVYVDNVVFKYHDAGVGEWDLSGHQANVKEFHSTKDMYIKKQLLLQHGDMSGTWTAEQKEMIEKMGMKPE
ncbi:MAG TPA: DUF1326 domain-containing protein [Candidatus Saccharimonadales bacterium]|nr:DUF1326 domain-containing protein [Candidatus Saccharimonadales bacterium]